MDVNNSLLILDWDDTLFPTSWIIKNNFYESIIKGDFTLNLDDLDNLIYKILLKSKKYCTIIIVTNAGEFWIKISSYLMPKTKKMLENIKIYSAREMFFYLNIDIRKIYTFNKILERKKNILNVISIGDDDYEYKALISLEKNKYLKSIKFIKKPSKEELLKQLKILNKNIEKIILLKRHVDKEFELN